MKFNTTKRNKSNTGLAKNVKLVKTAINIKYRE